MKIISSGRGIHSAEFYKKKRRNRRVKFILLTVGFLALIYSFVYLSRQERLLINEIVVQGEDIFERAEIISTAENLLAGRYLWVIPKANALLYPRRAVERALLEKFPRFKSVNSTLDGLKTLSIEVEERAPFALYCLDDAECYFLDEEGLIFARAPSYSGAIYFIYTSREPLEDPMGKRLIAGEEFRRLPKFIATLTSLDIYPKALEIGSDDYSLFLSGDRKILWRRNGDLALIRSNLEAFLSSGAIRAQEDFLEKIIYLDLRTENKVFYRFKE